MYFDELRKARRAVITAWARQHGLTYRDAQAMVAGQVRDIAALAQVSEAMLSRGVPVDAVVRWWQADDGAMQLRLIDERGYVEACAVAYAERCAAR